MTTQALKFKLLVDWQAPSFFKGWGQVRDVLFFESQTQDALTGFGLIFNIKCGLKKFLPGDLIPYS